MNGILSFVNNQSKITTEHKDLFKKYIMTVIAHDILGKKFNDQKEEWRMIGKKATNWINDNKDTVQKLLLTYNDLYYKLDGFQKTVKALKYRTKGEV